MLKLAGHKFMARYPGPEALMQPQTTMFDCWCDVLFMKYCVCFMEDVMDANLPVISRLNRPGCGY